MMAAPSDDEPQRSPGAPVPGADAVEDSALRDGRLDAPRSPAGRVRALARARGILAAALLREDCGRLAHLDRRRRTIPPGARAHDARARRHADVDRDPREWRDRARIADDAADR